jgi:peptide chain release factor 2
LTELDREVEAPNFWNDSARAQGVMRERQQLELALSSYTRFIKDLTDNIDLVALGEEEGDDTIAVDIDDKDVRIDTYRSSGAGGQHVNTTDSAVRITHVPTGIVVACQNERSQHKNRAQAMKQLKARLYEAELQKREAETNAANAAKTDIGWGHQIRSYVLQPYQLVKDLRTGVTSTSPSDVLDGDLDRFMAAALSQRVTGETIEVEDVE